MLKDPEGFVELNLSWGDVGFPSKRVLPKAFEDQKGRVELDIDWGAGAVSKGTSRNVESSGES